MTDCANCDAAGAEPRSFDLDLPAIRLCDLCTVLIWSDPGGFERMGRRKPSGGNSMTDIQPGDVWRARGPRRVPEADRRRVRVVSALRGDRRLIVEGCGPAGGRRSRPEAVTFPRRYELVERDGKAVAE